MSCHSRMESGLKKAPQDILLATNKEVRMRTDFFGRAHKIIHIDRCWNDTNCQSNCLPELSKLCPTLCVTGSERLSCPDSFLFCTEEHLMFQASAALPFLCPTAASQHRELCERGNVTLESKLLALGCCWRHCICP